MINTEAKRLIANQTSVFMHNNALQQTKNTTQQQKATAYIASYLLLLQRTAHNGSRHE